MKALRHSWLLLVVMLALVLVAAPARAADVDGKWSGTLESPMGPVQMGFAFKADGAALSGTSTGPDGAELTIKDGKVDGNKISFVEKATYQGMPLVFNYTGELKGDQIHFNHELMGFSAEEFDAKRGK